MLHEAIKYLAGLAQDAAKPIQLPLFDPRHQVMTFGSGRFESIAIPPRPRDHGVGSLADLVNLANVFHSVDDDASPVVWYDADAVRLVLDDAGHRIERATLTLQASEVYTALITNREWMDHKAFCRLLRIDLGRALPAMSLLEKVRRVRFENGATVASAQSRQSESMGRSISSIAFTEEGDLPEEVTLSMPRYRTLGECEPYPLCCSVEVDSQRGMFRLKPLPDELEGFQQLALASLHSRLEETLEEGICSYYGSP